MTNGARILVADDEASIRRSLKINLESRGYTVDAAETGEKAIKAFENRRPDLLILDLLMPGMDGAQLYRVIEARWPSLAPRVVFMTGDALNGVNTRLLAQTAQPRVEKPFTPEDVASVISRVCKASQAGFCRGSGADLSP